LPARDYTPDGIEFYDQINLLKAGLVYADRLTTVSPTYAEQIVGTAEFGRGLEGVLQTRQSDLTGILNGLDTDEWDASRDPFLAKPFSAQSLAGRRDCKIHLQQSVKLPVNPRIPVLGMVARLDPQKGADLLIEVVPEIVARGGQIVVLGQGDLDIQRELEKLEVRFPDHVRMHSDFNDPLAHHIYGGSDIFLMPSRFEPCGLGQLIAMRYGAIPVVSNTGGLHDTVTPVGPKETGTGFMFYDFSATAFLQAIENALAAYADEAGWSRLQARAMQADFSWQESAYDYVNVYRRALGRAIRKRNSIRIS
jgi:starch synthase